MRYLKRYDDMINEGRVKRSERLDVFRNDDIIVVMPLTHTALRKYANKCQWCINDDIYEWEDYHKGKHVLIIQRKPKGTKKGVTGKSTAEEIYVLNRWDSGNWDIDAVEQTLKYQFRNETSMERYLLSLTSDASNFATDIVYYSPESGSVYDMEDNNLADCNKDIYDVPNMSVVIVDIINDFVEEHEKEHVSESVQNEATAELINDIRERRLELTDTGALVAVIDWDNATPESLERDLEGFNLEHNKIPGTIRKYSINKGEGLVMVGVHWGDLEGIEPTVHEFMQICNELGKVKGPWGPLMYCMEDPNQPGAKLSGREGSTGKYTQDFVFVAPRDVVNEVLSFGKPSAELKRLKEEIKMRSYELSDLGAEVKVLDSEDTEPVWQGAEKTKRILDRYDEDYDTLYVSTDFRHAEGDWFDELRHFLAVCNEEGRIAGPNGPLTYLLNSEDPESYRDNKRLKDLNFIFVKPRKTKNMS